ncbi:MAG: nucleoside/nucleotide kinase family protein [Thermomicrobiales bacterium]|nr:nucleoside/nucleotide kinase family protein [Thermomicrobiales bacterium]MCO5225269.1 nucleoside/nucleotide kinase family protein [Thermomicrobiales bacterium]
MTDLVNRARRLAGGGERRILGITGAPGAGKSTLSSILLDQLGDAAVLVGMDGFHLANVELRRLGRRDRKGAPDTFDTDGYVALLRRIRNQRAGTIHAPLFDRSLEESIGSAIPVRATTPLVITEGNYLLLDHGGWEMVRPELDEVWYLDIPAELRRERLVQRRISYGDTLDAATFWVNTVDEANAAVIERTRSRADTIVHLDTFDEDLRSANTSCG